MTPKGLHYAMACNGSGVAMLSYLGAQVGRKILGGGNRVPAFDGRDFPTRPFYTGHPWMLPLVGSGTASATGSTGSWPEHTGHGAAWTVRQVHGAGMRPARCRPATSEARAACHWGTTRVT